MVSEFSDATLALREKRDQIDGKIGTLQEEKRGLEKKLAEINDGIKAHVDKRQNIIRAIEKLEDLEGHY